VAVSACDKAPLLAPGGTAIFLNASASSVSSTGTLDISAVLLEQGSTSTGGTGTGTGTTTSTGGTPVHNGTLVTFTTNIGRIEPAEAETQNGTAKVRFVGDGRSGVATIVAFSGGARSEMTLNVGASAAERIQVSATSVGSTGGTSTVTARVEDTAGNPLPGVSVQFSTTRGTLSAASATTNSAGVATVTLFTTSEAVVTATAGSKTGTATISPAARSGISVTAPPTITASSNAQFTVSVTSGSPVRDVVVNWGDGTFTPLGAVSTTASPNHTYASGGNYTVTATATMSDGSAEAASTSVSVGEFSVGLSCSASPSATNPTCTASVTPNTTSVSHYQWIVTASDGSHTVTRDTDGNVTSFALQSGKTYTVKVTVVPVTGNPRSNSVNYVTP
jgi:hypothetical protein